MSIRRFVILIIAAATATTLFGTAKAAFVSLDEGGNITTIFSGPQPAPGLPGYTVIDDNDARIAAYYAAQAVKFAVPTMQITSTSTPALNATYPIDAVSQQKVQAISLYVAVNGKFPAGQSTQAWPDVTGTMHQFQTTAQWQAFATAMGDFVAAIDLGQAPTQPVTIP